MMAEWFPVIWLGRAGELRGGHRHPERALRLESSTPCDATPAWRGCRAPRRVHTPRTRPIPRESSKRASNETKASGCDGLTSPFDTTSGGNAAQASPQYAARPPVPSRPPRSSIVGNGGAAAASNHTPTRWGGARRFGMRCRRRARGCRRLCGGVRMCAGCGARPWCAAVAARAWGRRTAPPTERATQTVAWGLASTGGGRRQRAQRPLAGGTHNGDDEVLLQVGLDNVAELHGHGGGCGRGRRWIVREFSLEFSLTSAPTGPEASKVLGGNCPCRHCRGSMYWRPGPTQLLNGSLS